MFPRLRSPRHSAYDGTFFWSGKRRDKEVRLYIDKDIERMVHSCPECASTK